MNVKEAIEKRRAYRDLDLVQVSDADLRELAEAARLAPSCFNNQPWKFVFARSSGARGKLCEALKAGNEWAQKSSVIMAAFTRKDYDCVIKDREYYMFDLGLAVSAMMLRATEMGLVAHAMAGFDPVRAREALGIPESFNVITLVAIGKKSGTDEEGGRPERLAPEHIYSVDAYDDKLAVKPER